jgi:hypothetical protein
MILYFSNNIFWLEGEGGHPDQHSKSINII